MKRIHFTLPVAILLLSFVAGCQSRAEKPEDRERGQTKMMARAVMDAEDFAPGDKAAAKPASAAEEGFVWPNQPPKDCPFEQSKQLGGVYFTGRHHDRNYGDTWYPSWASDGNLYSPWTDGTTEGVGSFSIGGEARRRATR